MQIRQLTINRFRGISSLSWSPDQQFCCIIGSGDSGKSTVLDAVEAVLSPRWLNFSESDFLGCDTSEAIVITITVGELSRQLKSDERFGLHVRGWTSKGLLRDEPEDNDEPVLTVRLTVDATLEPVWELICDRVDMPRTLSNRDRALFGLVRLAGEDSRHLAWGQGSVLSRLTGDKDEAAGRLAQAYKAARDSAGLDKITSLTTASATAEGFAKALGAYVEGNYGPGLELGRSGISAGAIALHDSGVPLRLAGLGTRRLATLAIQRSAIVEGAIVLIDEIEHGLEPHRIIGVISQLKASQAKSLEDKQPIGQILMTTHSDIALVEAGADGLFVCQLIRPGREARLISPESPNPIQDLLRGTPRALFARRILVVEGMTEVGLLLGLRNFWAANHGGVSVEQYGVSITDGNGHQAVSRSIALAKLGYEVALFRDSDKPLEADELATLTTLNISVFEYKGKQNTEQAIFFAASNDRVQELLNYVRLEHDEESVNGCLQAKISGIISDNVNQNFSSWSNLTSLDGNQLRAAVAEIAVRKKWFKDARISRDATPIIWSIINDDLTKPISQTIKEVEEWLYA